MRKQSALFVLAGLALVLAAALQQGALGLSTDALSNGSNTFTTAACFGDTGFLNPSAQAADTGGDGNGFEVAPTNAYADGSGNASNINGAADRHRYYDYSISVQTATICGIAVQLDWWLDSTAGTNSASVELSWDGGTSWTAAKTDATETTVEHTALLGGSGDTWGHAWTVSELSNAAFLVRVTSNSTSGSRDFFLDWVPVRVYWDPSAPTLTPTDTPTITPTPTNTPTPTDTPTPTATPTPLPNTGFVNCTADAAVTTSSGDNDGFEVTSGNACADDAAFAQDVNSGTNTNTSCTDSGKDRHLFYNYGFALPSGSTINGIRVRLDAWIDGGTSASRIMCVELSWDGGATWTAVKSTTTLTTTEATYVLGGTSDTWGRTWAPGDFSDGNFRVRITDVSVNNARDFSLDWAAVEVTYTPP